VILHREELVELEGYAKRQQRIWNDSCDRGIRIDKGVNEDVRIGVRKAIKEMSGILETRWINDERTNWSWQFFIPIEYSDDGRNVVLGTEIYIAWFKGRGVEFVSLDFHRGERPRS